MGLKYAFPDKELCIRKQHNKNITPSVNNRKNTLLNSVREKGQWKYPENRKKKIGDALHTMNISHGLKCCLFVVYIPNSSEWYHTHSGLPSCDYIEELCSEPMHFSVLLAL